MRLGSGSPCTGRCRWQTRTAERERVASPPHPRSIVAMSDSSHGTFADVLATASATLRPLCEHLRATVRELHPECVEVVWRKQRIASFGVGPKKMTEHYCYLQVHAAHVNLGFYRGAELPDRERLLEGTGKALRHVKLLDVQAAKRGPVLGLLRAAIAERTRATAGAKGAVRPPTKRAR